MGALKGHFQCLHGLQVDIKSNRDHFEACRWITIAIILHNMVIDIDGANASGDFGHIHTHNEELENRGIPEPLDENDADNIGKLKHDQLVAEIVTYKGMLCYNT